MRIVLAIGLFFFAAIYSASADENHLFGDLGGLRSKLSESGLEIESILTYDAIANVDGGVKRGEAYLGNYDLTATLDTEKAGFWNGGTVFVYALGSWGDALADLVGDYQFSSNIQSPQSIKIYEAWVNQDFRDGRLSVLFGLHDYISEYGILEYASGLINSSFGLSADIAQVGPSTLPSTSLAARIRLVPVENSYLQFAVYDGVPGDPNNSRGTHVKLSVDDGLFYGIEGGFLGADGEDYFKLALGAWHHTTDFENFAGALVNNNSGIYLLGERKLFSEEDSEQGLGGFIQLGFADSSNNQIAQYFGAGLSYKGLFPGREADALSVGVAHARNGDEYRLAETSAERAETALELNYRIELAPYFAITPDVQYIINPSSDPELDNATVIGARVELAM